MDSKYAAKYSTSFTYQWVRYGYLLGHNADLFWWVSTYTAVTIFRYPKIVIGLGMSGVPVTPHTPGTKKL